MRGSSEGVCGVMVCNQTSSRAVIDNLTSVVSLCHRTFLVKSAEAFSTPWLPLTGPDQRSVTLDNL